MSDEKIFIQQTATLSVEGELGQENVKKLLEIASMFDLPKSTLSKLAKKNGYTVIKKEPQDVVFNKQNTD